MTDIFKTYLVDLSAQGTYGNKTGYYGLFGFAISDYLAEMGMSGNSDLEIHNFLEDKILFAGILEADDALEDVVTKYRESDPSIVVIDFRQSNKEFINSLVKSLEDDGYIDLHSYSERLSFYKM